MISSFTRFIVYFLCLASNAETPNINLACLSDHFYAIAYMSRWFVTIFYSILRTPSNDIFAEILLSNWRTTNNERSSLRISDNKSGKKIRKTWSFLGKMKFLWKNVFWLGEMNLAFPVAERIIHLCCGYNKQTADALFKWIIPLRWHGTLSSGDEPAAASTGSRRGCQCLVALLSGFVCKWSVMPWSPFSSEKEMSAWRRGLC